MCAACLWHAKGMPVDMGSQADARRWAVDVLRGHADRNG